MPVLLSILSAFFAVDEELEDVRPGLPNLALVRLAGLQGCDLLHVNASLRSQPSALSQDPPAFPMWRFKANKWILESKSRVWPWPLATRKAHETMSEHLVCCNLLE